MLCGVRISILSLMLRNVSNAQECNLQKTHFSVHVRDHEVEMESDAERRLTS